jgi:hypothetical protein
MTWTLAISTLLTPELRISRFFAENPDALGQFDEVLVVCQRADRTVSIHHASLPAECKVIEISKRGISASRNAAIRNFSTDLIWFMDDDARLSLDLITIKRAIENSRAEINTLRIQDTASDDLFKEYGPERDLSRLELLRVSSIEITCKRTLLDRTGINFPEWIGVGTSLPSGEENLFLYEALRRGAAVHHIPMVGCRHPLLTPELKKIWSRPNRARCMGIVARRYGAVGLLLCCRWAIRGMRAGVPGIRLRELWAGYFQGEKNFAVS